MLLVYWHVSIALSFNVKNGLNFPVKLLLALRSCKNLLR